MKILLIGSGGREAALAHKLAQSRSVEKIHVAPGNGGIGSMPKCQNLDIAADNIDKLIEWAAMNSPDLTVVGPEKPLVGDGKIGIVDRWPISLPIFGPTAEMARLEGSKTYTKQLLNSLNIGTAQGESFTSFTEAARYLSLVRDNTPLVVKADGLAAGKGVFICKNKSEAVDAVKLIMDEQIFGKAGNCVVIEEMLTGKEISIMAICGAGKVVALPPAQDYKRAHDCDRGPNTGGMGSYSPTSHCPPDLLERCLDEIIRPVVAETRYHGLLYAGIILTDDGPKVLEFNCRFGDPETQVQLPRINDDFAELLLGACCCEVPDALDISPLASVCVVMTAGGYPDNYAKGDKIGGLQSVATDCPEALVLHAGTKLEEGEYFTNGGRVLNVIATDESIAKARKSAYNAVHRIGWSNLFYRGDIASGVMC